jgi:hypothetical protein
MPGKECFSTPGKNLEHRFCALALAPWLASATKAARSRRNAEIDSSSDP